jgi:hypothetical protein
MKGKILVSCIIMVIVTVSNGFSDITPPQNCEAVIEMYIDSYINADFKKLRNILSFEACAKTPRAELVMVHTKGNLVDDMKQNAIKQTCTTKYNIIAKSDALVLARVDFEYDHVKQQNFITLEKDDNKEWKITQIYKFYPANEQGGYLPGNATAKTK